MKLSLTQADGDLSRLALNGNVTTRELSPVSDPLGELLGPSGYGRQVLLDMSGAAYLDSSGVGWLLACHKRFRQAGGKLVIHSLTPTVSNVMKVLKLERVLEIATTATSGEVAVRGGAV